MFLNRTDAAKKLVDPLKSYALKKDTCVLSLTRGGIVLGYELAKSLHLPLDVIIVRKLGAPDNPEYAIGALSEYGEVMVNNEVVKSYGIAWKYIEDQILQEKKEIERRQKMFRGEKKPLSLDNKTVILVDDGLATGYTMKAAVSDVKKQKASKVIVAVPVGPPDAVEELKMVADEVICLFTPSMFFAVGNHYIDFSQVSDEEVIYLLQQYREGK